MSRYRRATIRPLGWHEDVGAHVDADTMTASHFDPDTQMTWEFPYGTYELIDVHDDDDEPAEEPHPCVCSVAVLMARGCVCGHLAARYRIPR